MKNLLVSLVILVFNLSVFSQSIEKIETLRDIENAFYENDSTLIVLKFHLKKVKDKVFYKDNLVLTLKDKFEHSIFQIYNDRFLVITAFSPNHLAITIEYSLKKNIIVIDTEQFVKPYYFEFKKLSRITGINSNEDGIVVGSVKLKDIKYIKPKNKD
ncbi:MAG: hypothetical protein EVB11_05700 [Winogradskyella sp.]|nr:MAG: hypothetical protein EVB11_05700 [Winogradskyella sp.]